MDGLDHDPADFLLRANLVSLLQAAFERFAHQSDADGDRGIFRNVQAWWQNGARELCCCFKLDIYEAAVRVGVFAMKNIQEIANLLFRPHI